MKTARLAAVALVVLLVAPSAHAQIIGWFSKEDPEIHAAPPESKGPDDEGFFAAYKRFMDREIEKVSKLDPYGVTSQLPRGYMAIKWQWDMITASHRYNDKRRLGPVLQPIAFGNPPEISIDMGLKGQGGGHTFQISYGITDPLDWYIEIPFSYMDLSFNPVAQPVDAEGNTISAGLAGFLGVTDRKAYSGEDFMRYTLPMLGRPTPGNRYKAKWQLGDINTGFSWNIFRTPRFSGALTARVFLPTGQMPNANENLTYATGPALEVGRGGWAVGFTQGYDLRIYKYSYWVDIIASTEFTASYGFAQERKYPTNFVTPSAAATAIDANAFPDLSNLKGHFDYTPGWGVDWTVKLGIAIAFLGLEVGYGVQHGQKPEVKGDPNFIQMVEGLELLGEQTIWAIQVGASVSLLALYVPLDVGFSYRKVVDGTNAIVFDDYFQVIVKGYIPVWPK